jgi:hypothetical protein
MVELTLIRTFVIASWEEARYLRERAVGFDRKFKDVLELQVQHLQSQKARCSAQRASSRSAGNTRPT